MKSSKYKHKTLTLFFVFSVLSGFSQIKKDSAQFMFPILPGQPNGLSGTMGELRSNHFHAGIDVKTYGKTGYNLYSIEDGYISRIKISPYGYGKAVYINHPTGYTSVYAHCSKLSKTLEKYVLDNQYEKQRFSVDLFPEAEEFKVKKGEVIAFSGNSGSSHGPHLHFEIRNKDQHALNPLKYNFVEITDNIKPTLQYIVLSPKSPISHIQHDFKQHKYTSSNLNSGIEIPAWGMISLAFKGYDMLNNAGNKNGIQAVQVMLDSQLVYESNIKNIPFNKTKMINLHMDYSWLKKNREKIQNCFIEDGNTLNIYKTNTEKGLINIKEEKIYTLTLVLKDAYGNIKKQEIKIKGEKPKKGHFVKSTSEKLTIGNIGKEYLKIEYSGPVNPKNAVIHYDEHKKKITAHHFKDNKAIFIYDWSEGLFRSCYIGDTFFIPNKTVEIIPSGQETAFENKKIKITFNTHTLADTIPLRTFWEDSIIHIGDPHIPLLKSYQVTIKNAKKQIHGDSTKYGIYQVNGRVINYKTGKWKESDFIFTSSTFGKFILHPDYSKPKIVRLKNRNGELAFKITDTGSGIRYYEATINGKFVLLEYNFKYHRLTTISKNKVDLKGEFKLRVTDMVGNETIYKFERL